MTSFLVRADNFNNQKGLENIFECTIRSKDLEFSFSGCVESK